jgi:hypothetical protein
MSVAVALGALAVYPAFGQNDRQIEKLSGESVAPVYDGYEVNPDGTYSMWFSYFNRNRQERLDIPVGPDNRFAPPQIDRGQPTHFVPLWQKSAFRVIVPKDFGDKKLVWYLTSHGQTNEVTATINPFAIIDRQKETLEGGAEGENKSPQTTVTPKEQTISLSGTASFSVSATDDGKPQDRRTKKPEGMSVRWRKFRGPVTGKVTFSPAAGPLVDGKASTKAAFSEPGEYIIQAIVDDGSLLSGTYCCWVNTELRVTVK